MCVLRHNWVVWLLIKAQICGLVSIAPPTLPFPLPTIFVSIFSAVAQLPRPFFFWAAAFRLFASLAASINSRHTFVKANGVGTSLGLSGEPGRGESAATCTQLVERFQRSFRHRQRHSNWGNLSVKCQTATRNLLRVASACCQRLCLQTPLLPSFPSPSASCPQAHQQKQLDPNWWKTGRENCCVFGLLWVHEKRISSEEICGCLFFCCFVFALVEAETETETKLAVTSNFSYHSQSVCQSFTHSLSQSGSQEVSQGVVYWGSALRLACVDKLSGCKD